MWQEGTATSQMNYRIRDLSRGTDSMLLSGSYGWEFAPEFSPSGKELAVSWNRLGGPRGLYVLSWPDLVPTLLAEVGAGRRPIGWAVDRASIVATAEDGIWLVPRSGGKPRLVAEVNAIGGDVTPDGRYIVTNVVNVTGDAWLIENFDPQAEARN